MRKNPFQSFMTLQRYFGRANPPQLHFLLHLITWCIPLTQAIVQYSIHHQSFEAGEEAGTEEVNKAIIYEDPGFEQLEAQEESQEQQRFLTEFLSTLNNKGLAIISLYYFHGWTQTNIAIRYGVSTVAINKRIHRILSEGRHYFADHYEYSSKN